MPHADVDERAAYLAEYRRRVIGGGGDLPKVVAHVRLLRESGMSLTRIVECSDVSYLAARGLWRGESSRVTRAVAGRIMAVQPGDLGDGTLVDRERADSIVTVLYSRGWDDHSIGDALGYDAKNGFRVQRPKVRFGTVKRLRALLEEDPPGTTLAAVLLEEAAELGQREKWAEAQRRSRQERGVARTPEPTPDLNWRDRAACRPTEYRNFTDVFFPSETDSRDQARMIARAAAICETCPVQAECGGYAKTVKPTDGVWNGQMRRPNPKRRNR